MWISKECERNVRSEISKYIRQIQLTDISCLSFDDSCAMLYVCSELLDVDTSWEENRILKYELERLLKKIRAEIYTAKERLFQYTGMSEKYGYYEKTLLKVINQPIKRYNFQLPILCHGYASIIAIQIGMYKECENEEFLQTLERNVKRAINIQNIYKDKNREYESDFSILQGTGGVMVTLADTLNLSMNYRKMLMIS